MISEKAGPAGGLAGTLITLRTWALKREFSVSAAEYRGSVEIQGSVCHQPLPPPQVMLEVKTCLPMQEMQQAVSIPASGKSLRVGEWQSTTVFMPGKSHGQRSLSCCSPCGHKRVVHNLVTKTTITNVALNSLLSLSRCFSFFVFPPQTYFLLFQSSYSYWNHSMHFLLLLPTLTPFCCC